MAAAALCCWITRSEPGASRLAAALADAGVQSLVAPVLEIVPLALADDPGVLDVQIYLSEHAVTLAPAQLLAQKSVFYAVGERTAAALAERGIDARAPDMARSEGLLALPELTDVAGLRLALVSGRGGRELLARSLRRRGAEVCVLALYARRPRQRLDVELTPANAIVVSSGDGFQAASRLWFAAKMPSDVPVFTPSGRVAAMASQLGFRNAIDCGGADPASVIRGIRHWRALETS